MNLDNWLTDWLAGRTTASSATVPAAATAPSADTPASAWLALNKNAPLRLRHNNRIGQYGEAM